MKDKAEIQMVEYGTRMRKERDAALDALRRIRSLSESPSSDADAFWKAQEIVDDALAPHVESPV